jgi:hypothetical protein
MATYTVTNTFTSGTTAQAAQVNTNFTDILTALNAFSADNLSSGTVPLARLSGLTSSQMAAAFFKDEDDMASNSSTAVSSQQALKAYVDTECDAHVGTAGQWHADGSTVFNTTMSATSTFQDLDLSAKVGSNAAIVHLEVKMGAGGGHWYVAKPKGYGSSTFSSHLAYGGGTAYGSAGTYTYLTVGTDSSGYIQHASQSAGTITIKLVGYVK